MQSKQLLVGQPFLIALQKVIEISMPADQGELVGSQGLHDPRFGDFFIAEGFHEEWFVAFDLLQFMTYEESKTS